MDQSSALEAVEAAELTAIEGGLMNDRVVIVGCTTRPGSLEPGQIPWNPWIGAPYPLPSF
jgi:hypothetical protein